MRKVVPYSATEEVSVSGTKRWIDAEGKPRRETRRFSKRLNPPNLRTGARAKTREELLAEVSTQRDRWLKKPVGT